VTGVAAVSAPADTRHGGYDGPGPRFSSAATFEVDGEVAEIVAATPDERTLLYTDSATGTVGVVDIRREDDPRQVASIEVGGSPTSVVVTRDGRRALVAVDTTEDLTAPDGHLAVVDLRLRTVVASVDLGGQPDSVALTKNGRTAAVAIENQRDETVVVDGVEGGIPQLPAGFLAVVDLEGPPSRWTVDRVDLTGLPGATFAADPEPEFVDVNSRGEAAVTLQENNAVAIVDLRKRRVVRSFSAGTVSRTDADVVDDGEVAFDDPLTAPREPDAVQWTDDGNLVTADEGDLAAEPSGGRGWTVFSPRGHVLFSTGAGAEVPLAEAGFYPDDRSDDKGAEFEGVEVADFRRAGDVLFVGAERGDAVLVYRFAKERRPVLTQVLAVGDAPEGLLALERRGLLVVSNEDDGTLSLFALRR